MTENRPPESSGEETSPERLDAGKLTAGLGRFARRAGEIARQAAADAKPEAERLAAQAKAAAEAARPEAERLARQAQAAARAAQPHLERAGREALRYVQDHDEELKRAARIGAEYTAMSVAPLPMRRFAAMRQFINDRTPDEQPPPQQPGEPRGKPAEQSPGPEV